MTTLSAAGAVFGYDDVGTGSALVLVHAGLADRRMWAGLLAGLAAGHRVVAYDWRGYGESSDLDGEVARHEDLLAVMDALELSTATLVGASMGGAHALDATLAQPSRVSGLVLISAVFSGFVWPAESLLRMQDSVQGLAPTDVTAMAAANVGLMVAGPERSLDDLDPAVRDQALLMCGEVFRREQAGPAWSERTLQPPASGRLHEVAVPTLVINGRCDLQGVQDAADQLTAGIAGAGRLDLENTGHLAPMERPEQTAAAILALLERMPAG